MITKWVDGCYYEIYDYDWLHEHEDTLVGTVFRDNLTVPEDSDAFYWHFQPEKGVILNVGTLRRVSEFTSELNVGLEE